MKLKLIKWRRPAQGQNTLLCPWEDRDPRTNKVLAHGMLQFSSVGDEQEIEDSIGYQLLAKYSDMLEVVQQEVRKKAASMT